MLEIKDQCITCGPVKNIWKYKKTQNLKKYKKLEIGFVTSGNNSTLMGRKT